MIKMKTYLANYSIGYRVYNPMLNGEVLETEQQEHMFQSEDDCTAIKTAREAKPMKEMYPSILQNISLERLIEIREIKL